jgi:hypothetical protein
MTCQRRCHHRCNSSKTTKTAHLFLSYSRVIIAEKQSKCSQGCCKPTTTARDVSDSDGTEEWTVSLVSNNSVLGWGGPYMTTKQRGEQRRWGSTTYLVGNPMRWAISSDNTLSSNASIEPNHCSKLKLYRIHKILLIYFTQQSKLWECNSMLKE